MSDSEQRGTGGGDFCLPTPPEQIPVRTRTLLAGTILHRVHAWVYHPDQFNPGIKGFGRFSPITDISGKPVPTMYAADTVVGALMESVFHDVPYSARPTTIAESHFTGMVYSTVTITCELVLADLTSKSLRGLGVRRQDLIECEAAHYAATQAWAKAIHEHHTAIHGLLWVSRQDDTAQAMMLFGDRIPAGSIRSAGTPKSLLDDPQTLDAVLDVADIIGVSIVPD